MTDEQKSKLRSLIGDYVNAAILYDEQLGYGESVKREREAKARAERTRDTLAAYINTL